MPLFNMPFILKDIKIIHKGILTSTIEMVLGVVVGLPEQYYATALEKREKCFPIQWSTIPCRHISAALACLELGFKNVEPSRHFARPGEGQEEGPPTALPLLHSLACPVTCPAGFTLQIVEHYLNRHPTVYTQQLAVFPSIKKLAIPI